MIIGILKEQHPENRVAIIADDVVSLVKLKVEVWVEQDAGLQAFTSDQDYLNAGSKVKKRQEILTGADLIISINPIEDADIKSLDGKKVMLTSMNPLWNHDLVKRVKEKNLTTFSMDSIPRTSRAQAMDILSSMATVAGYRAVLDAAFRLPTFFPMFMTAAGTIRPSKVLILGAGVAGLQALATSRKLGAQVEVFDVRAAVKEEVLSLGGKFVEVEGAVDDKAAGGYAVDQTEDYKKKQQQAIHDHAVKANVIICTAQIPGRKAPLLITKETVEGMKAGSVIIDLAASTGGNCEMTQDNKTVLHNQVSIVGNSYYPSTMPIDASRMFGKNVINFLKLMISSEGDMLLNFEDDIIKGSCITHSGEIINERVKSSLEQ